jgi:cyclase
MSGKNPYKKVGMFEGASYLLFEKAKILRKKMTVAEETLWIHLRKGVYGYKFRRQHPINNYIADFFCRKAGLIVEIDGSVHHTNEVLENDLIRQKDLENLGYTVISFSNSDIYNRIEKVLDTISQRVNNIIKSNTSLGGV